MVWVKINEIFKRKFRLNVANVQKNSQFKQIFQKNTTFVLSLIKGDTNKGLDLFIGVICLKGCEGYKKIKE